VSPGGCRKRATNWNAAIAIAERAAFADTQNGIVSTEFYLNVGRLSRLTFKLWEQSAPMRHVDKML
jgi:hypothetical protein